MTLSACGDSDTIKHTHPCEGQRAYEGGKKNRIQRKGLRFIAALQLSLGPEIPERVHPNTLISLGVYKSQHLGDNNLFFNP